VPRGLPILLLAAVIALGWNMSGYRLLEPDEGRNAEVAREMAQTNDYLVPHLDGLPYLDKPVVYFAAAAALMEVLGPTETAARLPAYLATIATIALLVWFARRRWGHLAGWTAGIAFATMPLTLAYAHTAIFDSTLSLCTTTAIIALFEGSVALGWAAMALGAITKGPVAIAIVLMAIVPYSLATALPLRRLVSWRALTAFAVVGLPWFLAVTARIPEFPRYAFVHETFERVTTGRFHRTGPVWYYLPILPVAAFPWTVPAWARLSAWRATWAARRDPAAREAIWLASWVLGPLVLFSLNQSKLPQYVLPLMPAFALAAARTLSTTGARAGARAYAPIGGVLAAVFVAILPFLSRRLPLTADARAALPGTVWAGALALVVSACVVMLAARRSRAGSIVVGYAMLVIVLPLASRPLLRALSEGRSSAGLASTIGRAAPGADVLAIATFPTSLPFYLRSTIPVATADLAVFTSNYIAAYPERMRDAPGSPLAPADAWRDVLDECPAPTVFVVRSDAEPVRAELAALPLLLDDGRNAAYGPCVPRPPSPHRGEGDRGRGPHRGEGDRGRGPHREDERGVW
jgi:4-amino-4-deoxy-L-arabinose transferase-like glycosyltransferase